MTGQVIEFGAFKAKKEAQELPPDSDASEFAEFHMREVSTVIEHDECLVDDLVDAYRLDTEMVSSSDYTLLVEAAMGLIMRAHGMEHPVMHPIVDSLFNHNEE